MIELIRIQNKLFAEIEVNNKKALMLFDTGAGRSYISEDFAVNCKIVAKAKSAGQTGGFGNLKDVKEISNILIDRINFNNHHFIIDEKFKKYFPCDGVLGIDLLSKMNIKLDFKNFTFSFNTADIEIGIPFSINKNKIYLNPKINGTEVTNLIFDTGATNLSIEKELVPKLNLKLIKNDADLKIGDSNGHLIDFETYKINTFEIENLKKQNIISYGYCFKKSRKLKNLNQNGIIGKSIFDGYIFNFDFKSKFCSIE